MSAQLLSLAIFNGAAGVILIKYVCEYIQMKLNESDERMLSLLTKLNKLEMEVSELNETIDTLEEKLQERIQEKEDKLMQSSDILFKKIDKLIISNYDTIIE